MDSLLAILAAISGFVSSHVAVSGSVFAVISEILMRLVPSAKPLSWVGAIKVVVEGGVKVLTGLLDVLDSLDGLLTSLVPQNIAAKQDVPKAP